MWKNEDGWGCSPLGRPWLRGSIASAKLIGRKITTSVQMEEPIRTNARARPRTQVSLHEDKSCPYRLRMRLRGREYASTITGCIRADRECVRIDTTRLHTWVSIYRYGSCPPRRTQAPICADASICPRVRVAFVWGENASAWMQTRIYNLSQTPPIRTDARLCPRGCGILSARIASPFVGGPNWSYWGPQ
jgi:hypothetical protein